MKGHHLLKAWEFMKEAAFSSSSSSDSWLLRSLPTSALSIHTPFPGALKGKAQ
jgi:hypothetical protein